MTPTATRRTHQHEEKEEKKTILGLLVKVNERVYISQTQATHTHTKPNEMTTMTKGVVNM